MCGICGVVQAGGEPREVVSVDTLDRMTDVMTHRGPDDRGTFVDAGVALGVRRLSIVDVEGGHQPVFNESGDIVAIQNGELYNHVDLRAELARDGHRFETRCDTEVIPHVYERDGRRFPRGVWGKFGIAVWDGRRRSALLARDRLGVKPLYYAHIDDLLVFGSEMKSVLASGLVPTELDYEAIEAYLTLGFFPAPATPLAAVRKLMPGHTLTVEDGHVTEEPYWRYPAPEPDRTRGVDETAEGLLAELDEAVRRRLMSDVPLGMMLSGGLDSSLIAALMARRMSDPVKTFSVGFAEDGDESELGDARLVAERLGAEHHELELSMADLDVDLASVVWHLDEPLADLSALGFQALSELASRHVTVALCGQGGDELLGGYTKHRAAAVASAWNRFPAPARRLGTAIAMRGPARIRRAARTLAAGGTVERMLAMASRLDAPLRSELFSGALGELDGTAARTAVASRLNGLPDDPLPATLYVDAQLALVDDMLHYSDRASMAHSLEARVPFLDHHVVEYCARIPPEWKVHRLTTKWILKRAARGLVPDEIIHKRKVGFFAGSVSRWFRAQTDGAIGDYLLTGEPRTAEFLNRDAVAGLVAGHAAGSPDADSRILLAILMLEIWLAETLPRAVSRQAAVAA